MWNYKIAMATVLVVSISANMASRFKTVALEEVTELKEADIKWDSWKIVVGCCRRP